ncbi:MAG: hypothetical protein QOI50_7315 [Pseudonocardiales bacterium]|jgi:hypothetical protein|nr:hypothetical protein [Pseudonocardiales bacterium]MDT7599005.1 hypothetical protein [Pseudonocardiales bacterium]MDT7623593.1 hypothetical protein [Pseudonocardiales bacterium]MDT7635385.1 hypothetical protein [Pseudonocardiales bacterium]MDT7667746.1 hypothetical protein [Pseudonocardiales bacterium]
MLNVTGTAPVPLRVLVLPTRISPSSSPQES